MLAPDSTQWFSRSSAARSPPEQQRHENERKGHLTDPDGDPKARRTRQLGNPDGGGEDGGEDAEVD